MSQLALLSDIHGNALALATVLNDIAGHDVGGFVCLGDIAAGGPQPREVIACLRELGCPTVRGNADGWLIDGLPPGRSDETRRLSENVAWARAQLEPAEREYLASLPASVTIACGQTRIHCFHGSPRSDVERLVATTPESEIDEALAGAPPAKVLAGGHTHLQLLRCVGDRLLINPGSVGLPLGSLRSARAPLPAWAEYALLDFDGGEADAAVTFRRVLIDPGALAEQTARMPHASWAADLERRIAHWNRRA
jgi:predicted phosphodiesterase